MELEFTELSEQKNKSRVSETVIFVMVLRKLSSGHGDPNKKKLTNSKLQSTSMPEDMNFNTIKDSVLILSAQEVQTEPLFIIHQVKRTARKSQTI